MRLVIIALAAGAAAIGSVAVAAKPSPLGPAPASGTGLPSGQCFRSHDMRNHTIADSRTLLVNVEGKGVYRLTMKGACLAGATASDPLVTRSPPGSTFICKPIDMDVSVSMGGFASPCIVDSVAKMAPEEVAALPKKLRP